MASFMDFNPANVLFGSPNKPGVNYIQAPGGPKTASTNQPTAYNGQPGSTTVNAQPQPSNTLGAESIRATGSGPFDSAYRQNLATYAGGNFLRPGGNLSFNPTDPNALMGTPTGGGNAPVGGIPTSLVSQAIGGQPFSFTPPPPPAAPAVSPSAFFRNGWQRWNRQFMDQGSMFRGQ